MSGIAIHHQSVSRSPKPSTPTVRKIAVWSTVMPRVTRVREPTRDAVEAGESLSRRSSPVVRHWTSGMAALKTAPMAMASR